MDAGRQAARRIGYSFAPECSSVQALPPLHVTVTEMSCSTRISCAYPVAQHKPGHARFSVVGRAHAQARAGSQSTQGRWKQAASSLAAIAVCESQLICNCMKYSVSVSARSTLRLRGRLWLARQSLVAAVFDMMRPGRTRSLMSLTVNAHSNTAAVIIADNVLHTAGGSSSAGSTSRSCFFCPSGAATCSACTTASLRAYVLRAARICRQYAGKHTP